MPYEAQLTRTPLYVDHLGRPCFSIVQEKGLVEHQSDTLLEAATASCYCGAIDGAAFALIAARIRVLASGSPLDIVEIGGTTGHFFDQVKDVVRSYVNVDPGKPPVDQRMVERLSDDRYLAICCSGEDVPLKDASADVVLALASLDHIPDVAKALGEIQRILRDGGYAILTLNNRGSWWKQLLRGSKMLEVRSAQIARDHYFQWTAGEFAEHVRPYLELLSVQTRTYVPYVPLFWRALLPVADRIGSWLLPGRGSIVMVIARRRERSVRDL